MKFATNLQKSVPLSASDWGLCCRPWCWCMLMFSTTKLAGQYIIIMCIPT